MGAMPMQRIGREALTFIRILEKRNFYQVDLQEP